MSAHSDVSLFRWKVVDFAEKHVDACSKGLTSHLFELSSHPSIRFEIFVRYGSGMRNKNDVRVILKQFVGKSVKAHVRLWIEHTGGQKFGETFVENHVFNTIGDFCGYSGLTGDERSKFLELCANNETFFFCCEMTYLGEYTAFATNRDQKFYQNMWALYEEGLHDAVIKIGKEEFKVSKFPFMSQSSVFKTMFLSKFKEGVTSKIEVKDVDAETMKHLVKWFYTNQLEDGSPVEKLFTAADTYDIKLLKETCSENLIDTLGDANAFQRLVLALMHNNTQLKDSALDCISGLSIADFARFLTSKEWHELYNKNQGVSENVGKLIREKMHK